MSFVLKQSDDWNTPVLYHISNIVNSNFHEKDNNRSNNSNGKGYKCPWCVIKTGLLVSDMSQTLVALISIVTNCQPFLQKTGLHNCCYSVWMKKQIGDLSKDIFSASEGVYIQAGSAARAVYIQGGLHPGCGNSYWNAFLYKSYWLKP